MSFALIGFALLFVLLVWRELRYRSQIPFLIRLLWVYTAGSVAMFLAPWPF